MQLNLPSANLRLIRRSSDGLPMVWDRLRSKFVALTPEEWVRQHFVEYLINHKGYEPQLMANEVGLKHNGRLRRCDTVVYDRGLRPLVIVEYKSPDVRITQAVFDQIVRYNSVLQAPYLMVSNGVENYCCRVDVAARSVEGLTDIPRMADILSPLRP